MDAVFVRRAEFTACYVAVEVRVAAHSGPSQYDGSPNGGAAAYCKIFCETKKLNIRDELGRFVTPTAAGFAARRTTQECVALAHSRRSMHEVGL